jgi:UDP-glucose 4-epimerase
MRVLITGGGGNLGRVLAPTLEEAGHEPILMDYGDLERPHKAVRGDLRDRASVLEVFRETDVVVHAAALHGIHLENYCQHSRHEDPAFSREWQHHGRSVRRSSTQTLIPGFQVRHGRPFDL